jgi:hypothetical protein
VILRDAGGEKLKTLGVFEAFVKLQKACTTDAVYIVEGLSQALMSRQMMKGLEFLHKDFPNHVILKTEQKDQLSGIVQALTVEVTPPKTDPKQVRYGPPKGQSDTKMSQIVNGTRQKTTVSKKTKWPQEPEHASETNMSSDEEEPHHNRFNVTGTVHGTPIKGYKPTRLEQTRGSQTMKEAIKPRPEAALVCGQKRYYSTEAQLV